MIQNQWIVAGKTTRLLSHSHHPNLGFCFSQIFLPVKFDCQLEKHFSSQKTHFSSSLLDNENHSSLIETVDKADTKVCKNLQRFPQKPEKSSHRTKNGHDSRPHDGTEEGKEKNNSTENFLLSHPSAWCWCWVFFSSSA